MMESANNNLKRDDREMKNNLTIGHPIRSGV